MSEGVLLVCYTHQTRVLTSLHIIYLFHVAFILIFFAEHPLPEGHREIPSSPDLTKPRKLKKKKKSINARSVADNSQN